jgi:hypothetical protein
MRVGSILMDASLNTIKVDAPADAGVVEVVNNAATSRSLLYADTLEMMLGGDTRVLLAADTAIPSLALAEVGTTNEATLSSTNLVITDSSSNNVEITASTMSLSGVGSVIGADISIPRMSVGDGLGTEAALWNGYATASLPPTAADHLTRKDYVDDATGFSPANMFYVAMNGSDASGNGSFLRPWRNIQYAIDQIEAVPPTAQTQACINVAPGHYVEDLTFSVGYMAVVSPFNTNDNNEMAELTGDVLINIITGANDKFNKQVMFQGIQISGKVTDTSTREHTVLIQDCYLFGDNSVGGQLVRQNSTVDCRTRIYNCEIASDSSGSVLPCIHISRGDCYMERLDIDYDGFAPVLLVDGSGAVFAANTDFTSSSAATASPGIKIVSITSSRTSSFGVCLFRFTSLNAKTNANGYFGLYWQPATTPPLGTYIILINNTFFLFGTTFGSSNANAAAYSVTGPITPGTPAIIYGNNVAFPGTFAGIGGTKQAMTAVS